MKLILFWHAATQRVSKDVRRRRAQPNIILVIGDFVQFMAIHAIYEQRTSGDASLFPPTAAKLKQDFN